MKLPKRVVAARMNDDGSITRYFEPPWIEPHVARHSEDERDQERLDRAALRRYNRANKRTPS